MTIARGLRVLDRTMDRAETRALAAIKRPKGNDRIMWRVALQHAANVQWRLQRIRQHAELNYLALCGVHE